MVGVSFMYYYNWQLLWDDIIVYTMCMIASVNYAGPILTEQV